MTDIGKIKSSLSKRNNSRDRCARVHLNGSTSPHVSSSITNSDVSMANNVLPHIGQIWSSNHINQLGEQLTDMSNHSDIQLSESVLTR